MNRSKHWRPGPDTAIALLALAIALGGVGYAATSRDSSGNQTINACANPAGGTLTYSPSGTCDPASGQTLITWSQQGPQGPPGAPGVNSSPVVANSLSQTFKGKFFVSTEIDTPGTYEFEGKVLEQANTATWKLTKTNIVNCNLFTGVPTSNAYTIVRHNQQSFVFGNGGFKPPTFYATIDLTFVQTVSNVPFSVGFACAENHQYSAAPVKFTNPALSVTDVSKALLQSGTNVPKFIKP